MFVAARQVIADGADSLSERAMDFISRHALEGITPEDVVRHLRVSKSLLYLRFRESTKKTVLEAILERRLGEVKRLLATTNRPIDEIAVACGYRDANYLKNQFRKVFGLTMRDLRRNAS